MFTSPDYQDRKSSIQKSGKTCISNITVKLLKKSILWLQINPLLDYSVVPWNVKGKLKNLLWREQQRTVITYFGKTSVYPTKIQFLLSEWLTDFTHMREKTSYQKIFWPKKWLCVLPQPILMVCRVISQFDILAKWTWNVYLSNTEFPVEKVNYIVRPTNAFSNLHSVMPTFLMLQLFFGSEITFLRC